MVTRTPATVQDLYNVPENGKAEIVNGELIRKSPTGGKPNRASGKIYASLNRFEKADIIYHKGEIVEAEPAVPGWRFSVDTLFK
jgi:hypothetical protein